MNSEQTRHLHNIQASFCAEVEDKYNKGQQQHGGNLWERDVVGEAVKEALDLYTYLHTARRKQQEAVAKINEAVLIISCTSPVDVEKARDILHEAVKLLLGNSQ